MAWSFEAKAGIGWAIFVLALMLGVIAAEVAARDVLFFLLLIPIVGYVAFFAWVFRVKK